MLPLGASFLQQIVSHHKFNSAVSLLESLNIKKVKKKLVCDLFDVLYTLRADVEEQKVDEFEVPSIAA